MNKLPALDRNRLCAHIAGELGIRVEQARFIEMAAQCRQDARAPDLASMFKRIRDEPRLFQAELSDFKAEAHAVGRDDLVASKYEEYLGSRIKLCEQLLRLSCFAPYYTQHGVQHSFAPDEVINKDLLVVFTYDSLAPLLLPREPSRAELRIMHMKDLGAIILLGEKTSLHDDSRLKCEQIERVYIPALTYLIRMAAEYSEGKMPHGYTIDQAQRKIQARLETIMRLASPLVGPDQLAKASLEAIEACLQNGDYGQGIKIAQARNLPEQLSILEELKRLVRPNSA